MAHFLRFPATTGLQVNNKALVQISGINGVLSTVRYVMAETLPAFISNTARYIFDIRRSVDSINQGAGTGWLLQLANGTFETNGVGNMRINGVARTAAEMFSSALVVADAVCEFGVNAVPSGGCIAFGARFNETEHNYGLAVKRIEIVDAAGTHIIDMSSSGGTSNTFTSTDGAVTLKLFNFTGNAHWVFYNSITTTGIPNNTLGAALNQPCAINLNNYFTGATSYSVVSGSLPAGLSISGNQIVGTPTTAQSTQFVIRAANSIDTLDSATITFNTGLWYLNNESNVDSRINIPSVVIGATVGDYIELRAVANAGNPNNFYRLAGLQVGSTNSVIMEPTRLVALIGNSTAVFSSGYSQPAVGSVFALRLTKTLSNQWSASLNGNSIGQFTLSTNLTLTAFGSINSSATEAFRGGFYHIEISTNGGASATRYYDPNTSGGVGDRLIDRVSNQNGTQSGTWPADNSEWVSYAPAGGATYTVGGVSLFSITNAGQSVRVAVVAGQSQILFADSGRVNNVARASGQINVSISSTGRTIRNTSAGGQSQAQIAASGRVNRQTAASGNSQIALSPSGRAVRVTNAAGNSRVQPATTGYSRLIAGVYGDSLFAIDADGEAFVVGGPVVYSIGGVSAASIATQARALVVATTAGNSRIAFTDTGRLSLTGLIRGASSFSIADSGAASAIRVARGSSGLSFIDAGRVIRVTPVSGSTGINFGISVTIRLNAVIAGSSRFAIDADAETFVIGQVRVFTVGGISAVMLSAASRAAATMNAAGTSRLSPGAQGRASTIANIAGISTVPFSMSGRAVRITPASGQSLIGLDIDAAALAAFGVSGASAVSMAASGAARVTFSAGGLMRYAIDSQGKGALIAYIDGQTYFNVNAVGMVVVGDQPVFGMVKLPLVRAYTTVRTQRLSAISVVRVIL